jgi:undecaprenyl pyrophosphate phosphatase UppP
MGKKNSTSQRTKREYIWESVVVWRSANSNLYSSSYLPNAELQHGARWLAIEYLPAVLISTFAAGIAVIAYRYPLSYAFFFAPLVVCLSLMAGGLLMLLADLPTQDPFVLLAGGTALYSILLLFLARFSR